MKNIKCIFCGSESSNILIEENGYKGRKCPICNLIYISPRPTFEEIIDLYGHDNANASAESHIKFYFAKTLYAKHTLKIIKKYTIGKLLEIGAGAGYFLNEARKQGFDVYAIEFNKIQVNFIKKKLNIPCEQSALNHETFNNKKFDTIYHCDVISHFYDPISEFKKINCKLKKDGFVIFETGNLGDVDTKYFKYYTKFQYPDHLFFFSENNIESLLKQTGFELIKIYRYSILQQLFLKKVLLKLTNYIKPNKTKLIDQEKKNIRLALFFYYSNSFYFIRNKLKNFYAFIFYFIRYKLGFIVLKKGRPQTMIIIAKKK